VPSARAGLQGLRASRPPDQLKSRPGNPLMGLRSPSESNKLRAATVAPTANGCGHAGSSREVSFPYSVSPPGAAASLIGFASPDRLHLQVFSTSWRLHPPRACWPCFMPDPLMGFCPSELCSSRAAVRRLRRRYPLDVSRPGCCQPLRRVRSPKRPRPPSGKTTAPPRLQGLAPHESPPLDAGCLGRRGARGSPGLLPSRVFPLVGMARPSPRLPSWASLLRPRTGEPAALQGLASNEIGLSLSRPPTLLGFAAF
jgi:hypothetical protein